YFDQMSVDLNTRNGASFKRDTITQYKKNKLETSFLEAPIELRYSARPDNMNKGWKFAFGAKIGTLVGAKVKSKVDLDATGTGGYISKEKDKRYLNTTRFALTARAGLGNLSFFGTYTVTSFFKEGLGPSVRPFSFGLALSGL
ncbi:MAG: PorT family protein, partial [Chitinophagaceae bacterium]|nr:PorT family protein [Chitinophagaceae bacterium]